MKNLGILLVISIALNLTVSAKVTSQKTTIYFNTTEYQLDGKAISQLAEIVEASHSNPDFEIFIEGHTDNRGSLSYNNELSKDRTKSVKSFLVKNGLNEKQIKICFKGELNPAVPNNSLKNMESNRRVEVTFRSYQFKDISELERELSPSIYQSVTIDPKKENLIKGKNGVVVFVPKNTFQTIDGDAITENIELEIVEALSFKDFISSGVETKSNGGLLETGGMVKVSAKSLNNREVVIADDKDILLSVPSNSRKKDMEVFVSTEGNDWAATNRPITNRVDLSSLAPFPVMKTVKSKLPSFRYKVAEPKSPKRPARVRIPHQPRKKSYVRHIPWYKLNKEKIREQQAYNYQSAVDRYDKRMERYERLEASYQKKLVVYKKKLAAYQIELDCWKEYERVARKEFQSTDEYILALKKQKRISEKHLAKYKEEVKVWRDAKQELVGEWGQTMDRLGLTTNEAVNNYVFSVNNLSWINVDRFYKTQPEDLLSVNLETEDIENERVFVLFKNINSMLSCVPNYDLNQFVLHNIPKKEEAFIFAYKVVDQRPQVSFMAMNGSESYHLEYLESSFSEIKGILSQFESS